MDHHPQEILGNHIIAFEPQVEPNPQVFPKFRVFPKFSPLLRSSWKHHPHPPPGRCQALRLQRRRLRHPPRRRQRRRHLEEAVQLPRGFQRRRL